MKLLYKIEFFVITAIFVLLLIASPAVAAVNPVATKSNELKLKACQAREQIIKTRMNNLERLTANMFEVFGKIEARVEEFYQTKTVANGNSVANYDTLVQSVSDKKLAAQTALDKTNLDSSAFSCSVDNPKLLLVGYKKDMLSVKSALKDYRTSIKNLIVSVKSANKESDNVKQSGSPKPTKAVKE